MNEHETDKKRIIISLLFPVVFVLLIWSVKFIEVITNSDFSHLGVYPLHSKGLIGILTGPLIHGDWKHLFNNSVPVLVLSWALFYFYKEISFKVFFLIYFIAQFWLWFFHVRPAWHIGASGLIYGLAAFLFVSGVIRKNRHLLAISLLVVFLYGSLIWGIFPVEEHISWEGHLTGLVAGIILAFYYKDFGPPLPASIYDDEDEEDDEDDFYNEYYMYAENPDITEEDKDFLNELDNR